MDLIDHKNGNGGNGGNGIGIGGNGGNGGNGDNVNGTGNGECVNDDGIGMRGEIGLEGVGLGCSDHAGQWSSTSHAWTPKPSFDRPVDLINCEIGNSGCFGNAADDFNDSVSGEIISSNFINYQTIHSLCSSKLLYIPYLHLF